MRPNRPSQRPAFVGVGAPAGAACQVDERGFCRGSGNPIWARSGELLNRARAAFAAGDYGAALAAVVSHAKRFPSGRLEEEREALAVKALVGAGRYDEAQARGARFRARFPRSFLAPTIDEALGTIP